MPEARRAREESRRLFFALWPSEAQQTAIERQMEPLVTASGGRTVPARNLHVTVVFLGEVPNSRFDAVKACAGRGSGERGFELAFDRVETWFRSRVLCLASGEIPDTLSELVERLRFNLLQEGFETRQEEYRPHVTLARDVKKRTVQQVEPPFRWRIEQFVLMESQRGPSGSAYTALAYWPMSRPD